MVNEIFIGHHHNKTTTLKCKKFIGKMTTINNNKNMMNDEIFNNDLGNEMSVK